MSLIYSVISKKVGSDIVSLCYYDAASGNYALLAN